MFLRQRKLKSYARIRNAENITKRLYLVNHMRSYMQRKIYKNNCPSSVEYHVECVFVLEASFDIYGIYRLMIILNGFQLGNQKDRKTTPLSNFEVWRVFYQINIKYRPSAWGKMQ